MCVQTKGSRWDPVIVRLDWTSLLTGVLFHLFRKERRKVDRHHHNECDNANAEQADVGREELFQQNHIHTPVGVETAVGLCACYDHQFLSQIKSRLYRVVRVHSSRIGAVRILISNDDGYMAPGLAALVRAMEGLGEVFVVAPERNRSGASNSLTLDRPLNVHRAESGFYYVNGTPTDCVHVAATGLFDDIRPDLVVSGINNGANMGDDTLYSGTVAAATEGFLFGLPAFAFSLVTRDWGHLDTAALVARKVVEHYLDCPMTAPFLLNVNVPGCSPADLKGMQVTRLGKRHPSAPVIRASNQHGEPVYWIGPAGSAKDAGPGTDFYAVSEGYVSLTPLQLDLTHRAGLDSVANWLSDIT